MLYISPQIETMLGYAPQAWYDRPRAVAPAGASRRCRSCPSRGPRRGEHNVRYRMIARRRPDRCWVHDQARLIVDEDGEPKYWQGVLARRHPAAPHRGARARPRRRAHGERTPPGGRRGEEHVPAGGLPRPPVAPRRDPRARAHPGARRPRAAARRMRRTWPGGSRRTRGASIASWPTCSTSTASAPASSSRCSLRSTSGRSCANSSPEPTRSPGRRLHVDTAPLEIWADAAMVERIVENLLGNAVKHTPGDARIWVRRRALGRGRDARRRGRRARRARRGAGRRSSSRSRRVRRRPARRASAWAWRSSPGSPRSTTGGHGSRNATAAAPRSGSRSRSAPSGPARRPGAQDTDAGSASEASQA